MQRSLRRLVDDIASSWNVMPKSQAIQWYGSLLLSLPEIVKSRNLYAADLRMSDHVRFRLNGRNFEFDLAQINSTRGNAYAFLREFFVRKIYFRAFGPIAFTTSVDLGCNIGVVSSILKELAGPRGRVVAVDAFSYLENVFRAEAERDGGVEFRRYVICGEATRHHPERLKSLCDANTFDPALAVTMDEFFVRENLTHVDFVKMDIEGAEFAIFADDARWLDRVDNIAMEVHSAIGDPQIIVEKLRLRGFDVAWCDTWGYSTSEFRCAGYIYASRIGALIQSHS